MPWETKENCDLISSWAKPPAVHSFLPARLLAGGVGTIPVATVVGHNLDVRGSRREALALRLRRQEKEENWGRPSSLYCWETGIRKEEVTCPKSASWNANPVS